MLQNMHIFKENLHNFSKFSVKFDIMIFISCVSKLIYIVNKSSHKKNNISVAGITIYFYLKVAIFYSEFLQNIKQNASL